MVFFCILTPAFAQQAVVRGTVYDGSTGNPVEYAEIVFVDSRIRVETDESGSYRASVPMGQHKVIVTSPGLSQHTAMIMVTNGSASFNFTLTPHSIEGRSLTVTGERKPQNISRRTMTFENLEEVPGSFGDAVSALSSMPGINQSSLGAEKGSMFGPLVIRGVSSDHNRYYIDGIPLEYPQHFFGMHSVIANEFMSEIDVYSSAYPAIYNGDYGAIIDIHSVDEVDKIGGYADFSLLSSTVLVKTPTYRTTFVNGQKKQEADGYLVVSGRIGYMTYTVPVVSRELGFYTDPDTLPQYWDYQVKYRHNFDTRNYITLLAVGARDTIKFNTADHDEDEISAETDPMFGDLSLSMDQQFFTQGASYTYRDSQFKNTVTAYATIPYYFIKQNLYHPLMPEEYREQKIVSKPMTYVVKNDFSWEWLKNMATLGAGLEYSTYYFTSEGESLRVKSGIDLNIVDIFADLPYEKMSIDRKVINHSIGGRLDNKFTIGGLTLFPQVRIDYLDRNKATSIDPRGMASYEFPTATTLSIASGKYHSFRQINPSNFNFQPESAAYGEQMQPEQSIHNVAGIEQKVGLYKFSVEGFYNYFYDLYVDWPTTDSNGKYYPGKNEGEMKTYGVEVMLEKEVAVKNGDFFGWASYTFTQAKYKTNLPESVDSSGNGDKWITSENEIEHAVKLVGGYRTGPHTISGKFLWSTTLPYTEITGGWEDTAYAEYEKANGRDGRRVVPIYSDDYNTKHRIPQHQLDLRYSYQSGYEWGYVKWYIEGIDVYQKLVTSSRYVWRYDRSYGEGSNPRVVKEKPDASGIPFFPNFGVEVKY